jgi:ribonuclease HI
MCPVKTAYRRGQRRLEHMDQVIIFTDGSCDTKSKRGGWCYLLHSQNSFKAQSGFETGTTNNRMELSAAVRALHTLKRPCQVTLTTDSSYLKNAFTEGWLATWQRNGWRTATGKPVKNQDLWRELLTLNATHDITWTWTKGHANSPENNLVDTLALSARKSGTGKTFNHTQVTDLLAGT